MDFYSLMLWRPRRPHSWLPITGPIIGSSFPRFATPDPMVQRLLRAGFQGPYYQILGTMCTFMSSVVAGDCLYGSCSPELTPDMIGPQVCDGSHPHSPQSGMLYLVRGAIMHQL